MADEPHRLFQARLIPYARRGAHTGVRTPQLRRYARDVARDDAMSELFLAELPHRYYEEYNLHAEVVTRRVKDIDRLIVELDRLLPYVDNWATCDLISPKLLCPLPFAGRGGDQTVVEEREYILGTLCRGVAAGVLPRRALPHGAYRLGVRSAKRRILRSDGCGMVCERGAGQAVGHGHRGCCAAATCPRGA